MPHFRHQAARLARFFLFPLLPAGIGLALLALAIGLALPLDPLPRWGRTLPAYVIRDVALVDVDAGRVRPGMTVAVQGGRIVAVLPTAGATAYAGWPGIDGRGRHLLPGLWDSHVHTLELSSRLHFPLLLASGVTSIRNLGDGCSWRSHLACPPDALAWQRDGAAALGPAIIASTGHHVEDLASAADAAPLVRQLRARRDDFVKIQLDDETPPAVVAALFAAAHAAGLPVAGHFPTGTDLADPRFARLVSLEHDHQLMPQCRRRADGCAALLALLAARRTAYVPTHVASSAQDVLLGTNPTGERRALAHATAPVALAWRLYRLLHRAGRDATAARRQRATLAQALRLTSAAHRAGVPVLAGTDALDPFVLHGESLHEELALLHQAGLSRAEVLRAATTTPADHFGWGRRKGRIAPGLDADLLLLAGDPLTDLGAARRPVAVMKGQMLFTAADLAAMRRFARAQAADPAVNARAWWALLRPGP